MTNVAQYLSSRVHLLMLYETGIRKSFACNNIGNALGLSALRSGFSHLNAYPDGIKNRSLPRFEVDIPGLVRDCSLAIRLPPQSTRHLI